jgi:hypothetical protein
MGGVASYIVDVGTHYHVTCCFHFNARLMGSFEFGQEESNKPSRRDITVNCGEWKREKK